MARYCDDFCIKRFSISALLQHTIVCWSKAEILNILKEVTQLYHARQCVSSKPHVLQGNVLSASARGSQRGHNRDSVMICDVSTQHAVGSSHWDSMTDGIQEQGKSIAIKYSKGLFSVCFICGKYTILNCVNGQDSTWWHYLNSS